MTISANTLVTKFVKLITEADGSSVSTATTAKLTAAAAIIGEVGDLIIPSLENSNKDLSAILDAINAIEDDADKLHTDIKTLVAAFKGTSSTVAQPA
ncbi:hypothetical protein C0V97_07870 [Asaia sp. W19]|uniref:hypothetical protein n=1 Tax=unclassified Asaia TaxID=2685023 RepID=UPI000F8F7F14|nr:hypothetical protein [Asaia sp. W19]RUT26089.1 hypothetical protein C0V97_07870 [Asaia sp. W19]